VTTLCRGASQHANDDGLDCSAGHIDGMDRVVGHVADIGAAIRAEHEIVGGRGKLRNETTRPHTSRLRNHEQLACCVVEDSRTDLLESLDRRALKQLPDALDA